MVRRAGILRGAASMLLVSAVLAAFWFAGRGATGPGSRSVGTPSENVVFILVDTLRADRLYATRNGLPVMPKLASLAERSWNFTNAISQSSWTKPSVTSIFTSLYPNVHNVQFGVDADVVKGRDALTDVLPDSLETMAEYFSKGGYRTAAIQTNAMIKDPSFGQGFDSYDFRLYPGFPANEMTEAAIEKLDSFDGPFFLYLQYLDPHMPYDPPGKYKEIFGPLPELHEEDRALLEDYRAYYTDRKYHDVGLNKERTKGSLSESARQYIQMLYDGESRFIDDEVMRLIDYVLAHHPDTVIVLTADHGEELWDHGAVGHGTTVFQELIHVPLIFRFPDTAPRHVSDLVETIDILPTLAARLGLRTRPYWQGVNLIADREFSGTRSVFSETRTPQKSVNIHIGAVFSGSDKLITNRVSNTAALFDLVHDPGEIRDRSAERAARVAELTALWQVFEQTGREHPAHVEVGATSRIDAETLEQLQVLGYGTETSQN